MYGLNPLPQLTSENRGRVESGLKPLADAEEAERVEVSSKAASKAD